MDRLSSNGQMLSQIDLNNVPHSSFDRTNHNFLSCKLGKLVVSRLDEVYPGDRIKGHIEAVANFEPLVSPILGSMVMKQESFYVPDSILWKNAHKFFTAKGGFNTPMPSVSPNQIYNAFSSGLSLIPSYVLGRLNQMAMGIPATSRGTNIIEAATGDIGSALDHLKAFAAQYGIVDLVQPIEDHYNKLFVDVYIKDGITYTSYADYLRFLLNEAFPNRADTYVDQKAVVMSQEYKQLVEAVAEMYYFYYEYLFGVSSHLDYMGHPVNDHWFDFFVGDLRKSAGDWRDPDEYKVYSLYSLLVNSLHSDGSTPEISENIYVSPESLFSDITFNWLPFRAAYVVWYWNYRDELLETDALDPESDSFLGDTPSPTEICLLTFLRVRCWYKDSFTTALTNTGSANLSVPTENLFGNLDVQYFNDRGSILSNTSDMAGAISAGASYIGISTGGIFYKIPINYFNSSWSTTGSQLTNVGVHSSLSLDLFDRIHRLRTFLQKRLILGYEYDDMLWSSFMVKLSNVRMRIPELLARGRDAVQLNTVVNNTTTTEQIAGDKSAVAWCSGRTSDINYFAEEHGYFISFITIMPVQTYTGGMQRLYMKREQFDFMWPEFATMGMDAVYNFELSAPRSGYANYGLTDEAAMQVFGYQGRYYDLKSRLDECHGRLRTDLKYMTFSREFNMRELPVLNYQFVHCWPSTDMFVVEDDLTDVVRTVDVFNGLDFERRLPVPSEML